MCTHYWYFPTSLGQEVEGVCLKCHQKKKFKNYIDEPMENPYSIARTQHGRKSLRVAADFRD